MPENNVKANSKIPFENFMLSISIFLVALFVGLLMVSQHLTGDYPAHIEFSELIHLDSTFSLPLPHFLYHIILAIFTYLTPLSAKVVSILLMTISITSIVYILWRYIRLHNKTLSPFVLSFLVISLVFITPASILKFNFDNPNFYYAFFHSTPYHNPTYLLSRPFILITTLLSLKYFSETPIPLKTNIIMIMTIVLGALAKPSYLIAFLPAIALFAMWYLYRKQAVQWKSLIFSIIIPSFLLLLWQFLFTYIFDVADKSTSIVFDPLTVLLIYVESANLNTLDILFNLFLTVLFPIVVLLLYPKSRNDSLIQICWLIFLIAVSQAFLFAETGDRLRAGNFLWGGHLATFLLYAVSIITVIKLKLYETRDWRFLIVSFVFLSHLISGILWFYYNWQMPGFNHLYW